MKNQLLLTLVLASLTAGILLLWFEDSPSTEKANKGSTEQRSQLETKDSKRSFGPGERDAAAQISTSGPHAAAVPANSPAPVDVSASKPPKQARTGRAASEFPDDEEPEEFVIGGLVQDEEGNPLSNVEVLAERLDISNGAPVVVDSAPENVRSTFSEFDGAFLFDKLEDNEYRVRLAPAAGIAPAETRVRAGTLNVNLVVVELRDIRVYGTVNSTDGTPIEDVHIVAATTNRSTGSGSKGEYELDINWQGNSFWHSILFQREGFKQQQIRINPAGLDGLTGGFQLNVSMEPLKKLTTVTGRLSDTEGGQVGGEILHLLTPGMRTSYRAQSDARGNFLFKEVEPGKDHQLTIRPESRYKKKRHKSPGCPRRRSEPGCRA